MNRRQQDWLILENVAMSAWPAFQKVEYDGWILRFADGFTKRSNSINPMEASSLPLEEKIDHCERMYRSRGLPPIFRITPFTPPRALDGMLASRGYEVLDPTRVMTASASSIEETRKTHAEIIKLPMDEWLDHVDAMSAPDSRMAEIRRRLLRAVAHDYCCLIAQRSGHSLGYVLGIESNDFLGVFMLSVMLEYRRKGLGSALTGRLLEWGQSRGVNTIYLQVEAANVAARALYASCGFVDGYCYWYRVAGNGSATLS